MNKQLWLLTASTFALVLIVPGVSRAQMSYQASGNRGYGMFGQGSGLGGMYSGQYATQFSRGYVYNQDPNAGLAYQNSSGNSAYAGPLGKFGLGTGSYNNTISPYLNLLRPGSAAVNYYGIVRPMQQQQAFDWGTSYKAAEKAREDELRASQGLDRGGMGNVDWSVGYRQAQIEGEKEARIRAGEPGDTEYRDWATSYRDLELRGETKADQNRSKSRQRAANLKQAQALRELDAELSAGGNAPFVQPQLASGLQSFQGPQVPAAHRNYTHFYPSQGGPVGRLGGGAGGR